TTRSARTGSTARASTTPATAAGVYRDATQITLTQSSAPGRLDPAVFVIGRGRDPRVEDDIGIGASAERAVDILEHHAIPACETSEFTGEGPSALLRWEIHRLGVLEAYFFDGVVRADPKAGV